MLKKNVNLIVTIAARGSVVMRTSMRVNGLSSVGKVVTEKETVNMNWPEGLKIWSMAGHVINQIVDAGFHGNVCFIVPESQVITGYSLRKELKNKAVKSAKALGEKLTREWMDNDYREMINYLSNAAWKAAKGGVDIDFFSSNELYYINLDPSASFEGSVEKYVGRRINLNEDGVDEENLVVSSSLLVKWLKGSSGVVETYSYKKRTGEVVNVYRIRREDDPDEVTIAARKVTEINNKSLSNLSVEEYELVGNNF